MGGGGGLLSFCFFSILGFFFSPSIPLEQHTEKFWRDRRRDNLECKDKLRRGEAEEEEEEREENNTSYVET